MNWLALVIAVLILTGLWILWRAGRNERAIEAAHPRTAKVVHVNGHEITLDVRGHGAPIVLIHGASGNLMDMTFALAPALADRFTVISVDRPGLGHSPALHRRGETLREQADILQAAVEKLGFSKVYVLGQSYGGAVALAWALAHPNSVAGLVLVSAPSNPWDGGLGLLYTLNGNPVTGPIMRAIVAAFPPRRRINDTITEIFSPQAVPKGYARHIAPDLTIRRKVQRANALQLKHLKGELAAMAPRYGEITIPVEAIHGTADTIVPEAVHNRKLRTQIRDFHETILPGMGHMPHITQTEAVVQAVVHLDQRVGLQDPDITHEAGDET